MGTGGPPPLDTSTVNTRESMGREGSLSARLVGGGTAALSWARVAEKALLTMAAQEAGEKKEEKEEKRLRLRRACAPPPPPLTSLSLSARRRRASAPLSAGALACGPAG